MNWGRLMCAWSFFVVLLVFACVIGVFAFYPVVLIQRDERNALANERSSWGAHELRVGPQLIEPLQEPGTRHSQSDAP